MYELKVELEFSAAHRLNNYEGKCERLHGHNWTVEAIVRGAELNEIGIVIDFKIIKAELKKVLDEFNHQYLNELEIFANQNPSAENIAREIFNRFSVSEIFSGTAKLHAVSVYETHGSCATYYPD